MPNTVYANTSSEMVASGGGLLTVAVGAASTVQANSGTALPCKVVYCNALCSAAVMVGINVSANVSTAVMIPTVSTVSPTLSVGNDIGNFEIPIDDVSKLWFYATSAASVNITYRY